MAGTLLCLATRTPSGLKVRRAGAVEGAVRNVCVRACGGRALWQRRLSKATSSRRNQPPFQRRDAAATMFCCASAFRLQNTLERIAFPGGGQPQRHASLIRSETLFLASLGRFFSTRGDSRVRWGAS